MDDGNNIVLANNLRHQFLIPGFSDDKWYALRDGPLEASRQIVKDNDALTGIDEFMDHVAADIAGTASYKN
jgi:hypothetical protein